MYWKPVFGGLEIILLLYVLYTSYMVLSSVGHIS